MGKFIRYGLAAICFTASVGCWALWWRSMTTRDVIFAPTYVMPGRPLWVDVYDGHLDMSAGLEEESRGLLFEWQHASGKPDPDEPSRFRARPFGYFSARGNTLIFPIWYPVLVFALAGVGVLRCSRQFSIRSALIGLAVAAALLGLPVAM